MGQLVTQQLGDKANYDSVLHDLTPGPGDKNYVGTPQHNNKVTGVNATAEKPLENLIREALNYDSVCYRQALGIEKTETKQFTPNGVFKSHEFEKQRRSQKALGLANA